MEEYPTTYSIPEILRRSYDNDNQVLKTAITDIQTGDIQNPLPIDGDSMYQKDIDEVNSNMYNFTGSVLDMFNSLYSLNEDSTANNPKELLIMFKRTFVLNTLGLGCNAGQSFSNLKIFLVNSGGVELLVYDGSLDSTPRTTLTARFSAVVGGQLTSIFGAIGVRLQFHSTSTICITNCYIPKVDIGLSFLQAQTVDGIYVDLQASRSGNLKVSNSENGLSIAKGEVADTTFIHKFGEAPNIDVSDGYADVWDGVNDLSIPKATLYTFSTTNDIDSISSSDITDTQVIEISGLDVDYNEVIQTVTLQGQTTVNLTTPLLRVYRMINRGRVDIVGEVYLYVNGAALTAGVPDNATDVRALINNGNNQTLMTIYTVPAGFTAYMRDWYASLSKDKVTTSIIKIQARPFGEVFQIKHKTAIGSTGTSYIQHSYTEPEVFTEKTDIKIQANTSTNDSGVGAGFDIVLVKNSI